MTEGSTVALPLRSRDRALGAQVSARLATGSP